MATYSKDNFCEVLLNSTDCLNNITLTDDIDEQVNILNTIFISCLNQVAPMTTKYINRPPAPWIDKELKDNMKYRDNLQGQLKLDRHNTKLYNKYKEEKKRVKDMLQTAKKTYYHNQLRQCKGNPSQMWSNIRGIIPNNKPNNIITDEDINDKAEDFNNYFANVGRKTFERCRNESTNNDTTSDNTRVTINNPDTNNLFRPKPVDVETVILTISKLKETKSVGSDGISLKFIKDSLSVTAFYITCIFNTSIVTGKFPTSWKHAIVVPIFKGGDSNINSNYRPISLLPVISKVLEKKM